MVDAAMCTVTVDGRDYDVTRIGDDLRVSPREADELAETVSLAHLPADVRQAVENNDVDDAALQRTATAMARAIAERGA